MHSQLGSKCDDKGYPRGHHDSLLGIALVFYSFPTPTSLSECQPTSDCTNGGGRKQERLNREIDDRADIHTRYSIRGGIAGDSLTSCCCNPCALTQERRDM
ncbi:hypothetical protein EDB92DRAFT_1899835 [Lactarius akahatsu]|uniref:Uncharacterized protein n=1 Tax=Lactarius akahatsu TaxID=416441 RepID=A0AAD4Q8R8_9AGAM|nr:hypothetical protein EDB92DRAFT_1899835 [Lactarius akahatsu]